MDHPDRSDADHQRYLNDLRRDAYARPTTPAERQRAAEAQRLLADEESRARVADESAPAPEAPETMPEADEAEPLVQQEPRRSHLVAVAAAALVVGLGAGFGGGAVSTSASRAADDRARAAAGTPDTEQLMSDQLIANVRASGVPYVSAGRAQEIAGTGDSHAALRWLESAQTPADIPAEAVAGAEAGSLHLAYESATWGRVWIARGTDETLCFYWSSAPGNGSLSCTDTRGFDAEGLSLSVVASDTSGVLTLRWDGQNVLAVTGPGR